MSQTTPTRPLGRSGLSVPALGVGTNRWRQGTNDGAVLETYRALLDAGAAFLDTAEVYGFGRSERLIGDCRRADPRQAIVASKFAPFIGRASSRALLAALDASLARLGLESLDLYYVHFPFPFTPLETFAEALIEAVKRGKTRAVGVSNFGAEQMRRMADLLGRAGVPLAANEVHYSLASRKPETNGVLDACRELDVALVAYFPLASGRLTAPPSEPGKDPALAKLRHVLNEVAAAHLATEAQAALAWLVARDRCVIPIPGATKARHASENLGAFSLTLTADEFGALDTASAELAK